MYRHPHERRHGSINDVLKVEFEEAFNAEQSQAKVQKVNTTLGTIKSSTSLMFKLHAL